MTPYYRDDACVLYHGRCEDVLPTLPLADHVITDPPYDAHTHANVRTMQKEKTGRRRILKANHQPISFDALSDVSFTADLWRYARRWTLVFCSLEMLGDYKRYGGEAWVRSGVWRKLNGIPQVSGDRPGQAAEGISHLHHPDTRKRWHGGGHLGYYEGLRMVQEKVHPAEKPIPLMLQLVELFTDPGDTILDPYCGSGSTLVAAKRLGRKAIGIEMNERYCALTVQRLQQEALPIFQPSAVSQANLFVDELSVQP